jgi:hypothetical protein
VNWLASSSYIAKKDLKNNQLSGLILNLTSVRKKNLHTGRTAKFAQWCSLLVLPGY